MPTVEAARRADRPLVVLAENFDGPRLQLIVSGNVNGTFAAAVVRAPGFGHRRIAELEDLAAALGGRVVSEDSGITLTEVTERDLGRCEHITITEDTTTIIGGAGEGGAGRACMG